MAGFKTWGSETLLSSDVDNYLMKQANIAVNNGAEPTGEEGMEVHNLDTDRARIYNGSAWIRTGWWSGAGRTGTTAQRAATQSIPNSAETTISWDTETSDSDGYLTAPSGTITVPAGLSGLYILSYRIDFSAGVGSSLGGIVRFYRNSTPYGKSMPVNATQDTQSHMMPWNAGDTLTVSALQTSGAALNVTGRLDFYRLGA